MNIRDIAQVCHEAQRAYKIQIGEDDVGVWAWAPKEMKDSTIAGVEYVMNNPNTTAEHQHMAWVKHKKDAGWLYGPEKSNQLKQHPCIIHFSKLPLADRTKDALFIATALSLLPMQNYIGE